MLGVSISRGQLRKLCGKVAASLDKAYAELLAALPEQGWTQATFRVPDTKEAGNLANRFHDHGREYLRFITTPDIEPTNNLAEQAIRFVVIDRRITQGTRSAAGRTWCERIWTTLATCTQKWRECV